MFEKETNQDENYFGYNLRVNQSEKLLVLIIE